MLIRKQELGQILGNVPFRIIFGLGFDERSLNVLEQLVSINPRQVIALADSEMEWAILDNLRHYQGLVNNAGILIQDKNTLVVADRLSALIQTFDSSIRTIIDITAMSNEMLAILIALLRSLNCVENVILCYTGAAEYSFNSRDKEIWLSKGVSSIRSVLGYPGLQLPSRPLHLVLMTGFEVERAFETIARFEPAVLSLGVGQADASVSAGHYEANLAFSRRLEEFIAEQERTCETLTKFTFSCIDPSATKQNLQEHLGIYEHHNLVVCPLNTKLSTVGASLYCLENPEVQLCYTQPMEYNLPGYARAGDTITWFNFDNLLSGPGVVVN